MTSLSMPHTDREVCVMASTTVERLKEARIKARDYTRPPKGVRSDTFMASIYGDGKAGTVLIWEGHAEIETFISPKNRQAVLNVTEGDRVITQSNIWVRHQPYVRLPDGTWGCITEPEEPPDSAFTRRFNTALPRGTRFKVLNLRNEEPGMNNKFGWLADVEATLPHSTQSLLMGMDETANFIAVLPERATSVRDAHRMLRPEGIANRQWVKRQGEWFFTPLDRWEAADIDRGVSRGTHQVLRSFQLGRTTHSVTEAVVIGSTWRPLMVFARGKATDTRTGHHKPVVLPDWHRVDRNRERLGQRGVGLTPVRRFD